MTLSLDDWWEKHEVHSISTAEYWRGQQCSLDELNEWIKKINKKDEEQQHNLLFPVFDWGDEE